MGGVLSAAATAKAAVMPETSSKRNVGGAQCFYLHVDQAEYQGISGFVTHDRCPRPTCRSMNSFSPACEYFHFYRLYLLHQFTLFASTVKYQLAINQHL